MSIRQAANIVAGALCLLVPNALHGQTVMVDAMGKNVGATASGPLANAVVFGASVQSPLRSPLNGQLQMVTSPPATGIGSNQQGNGVNYAGLDFYTPGLFGAPGVRMSLTRAGALGLGTSAPAAMLEIDSPGRSDIALKSGAGFWAVASSSRTDALPGTFQIIDRTSNKARLSIDSGGTVSIGVLEITGGSDVAEPFAMGPDILPGSVMVIDEKRPGALRLASEAYDRRVAGVVSGAGGVQPGLTLRQIQATAGQNLALSGRVYALAEASGAPIHPGDLLTTSARSGRCMKVTDPSRSAGAILGKAMSSLETGEGLVFVLVTLE